jgi:two-component system nitrogen regulation response regulator GlnG
MPALPPDSTAPVGVPLKHIAETAAAEAECRAIRQALRASRGNKSEAARILNVDYKTLHLKMKRYRISTRDFRA